MSSETGSPPPFRVVLSPHRSLKPAGFAIVMGLIAGVSFVTGIVFLILGAWPVLGFLGLDVVLVYWAFRRNFSDGRVREIIEINERELVLWRVAPGKKPEELRFPRAFVRVELEEDRERELIGALALRLSGRSRVIGSFLSPEERKGLAVALRGALARPRSS